MVNAHPRPYMLTLTDNAVKQLQSLLAGRSESGLGLRLDVEKGGCAGFQYIMKISPQAEGDTAVSREGVSVFIGAEGASMLQGCSLDYVDSLHDGGFRVENPNAERSCGCGTSFEPKKS
jgi:iron-sulfur cluster assembly protein